MACPAPSLEKSGREGGSDPQCQVKGESLETGRPGQHSRELQRFEPRVGACMPPRNLASAPIPPPPHPRELGPHPGVGEPRLPAQGRKAHGEGGFVSVSFAVSENDGVQAVTTASQYPSKCLGNGHMALPSAPHSRMERGEGRRGPRTSPRPGPRSATSP